MYELTASEAATVLSVLAKDGGGEQPDNDPQAIPSSTFFATRRRIYDSGWLSDRYVPNPWAIGRVAIDCVLAKPSPAERIRLEREWASSAECVVLWSGLNVLLGIFFRQDGHAPNVQDGTAVSIGAGSGRLPVYFDYSRSWSRFIRVEGETGYPRPLGETAARPERTSPLAVPELILKDQHGDGRSSPTHRWHSRAGLSRSQQRLLDRGAVRSRTFLNLDVIPPYDGRTLGEIVFLTGDLKDGVASTDVLGALSNECHVSPILLADDGTKLLILALGQIGLNAARRTRVPRAANSVTATLHAALKNVQMAVEHTDSVRKLVDHRYDRLFTLPRDEPA